MRYRHRCYHCPGGGVVGTWLNRMQMRCEVRINIRSRVFFGASSKAAATTTKKQEQSEPGYHPSSVYFFYFHTRVQMYAPCCDMLNRRRCGHNKTHDHEIDQYAITHIQCTAMRHATKTQSVQHKSVKCGAKFAWHYLCKMRGLCDTLSTNQ